MKDTVIIHTDEVSLKGGNRRMFERLLVEDIRRKLRGVADFAITSKKGTVLLRHRGPITADAEPGVIAALSTVFGAAHFLLARSVDKDIDAVAAAARELMADRAGVRFRVTARRADKTFPMDSMEIARHVGGEVLGATPDVRVDLHDPEVVVRIEIGEDAAYVAVDRHDGAGGLPVGSTGTVASLLSGGIDSPVASWRLMRRGARAVFIHFHSYPFVGRESVEKVERLAAELDRWQRGSILYLVPFGELQREITAKTDERLRVVLYRRFMLRIAERLAKKEGALALVTGDALGQVASQTLENIRTVSAAAELPILRPLVGDDKRDIINAAKRIGTYETSIEPHDDCCTLFVPKRPELRATPRQAEREEERVDVETLVADAVARAERKEVTPPDEAARVTRP